MHKSTSTSIYTKAHSSGKTYYVGQSGLARYYFTNTAGVNHNNWVDLINGDQVAEKLLMTAPEVAHDEPKFRRFYGFRSYFKAP